MKNSKFFKIAFFLLLLILIPIVSFVLMNSGFELRISALESDEPANVIISDIKSNSFKVSWITEKETLGSIKLSNGEIVAENETTSFHSLKFDGLKADTNYSFSLLSGSKEFKNPQGQLYTFKTAVIISSEDPFLVYGQVFSSDGFSVQQNGIITMTLENSGMVSNQITAIINETGGYQFDLGGLLSENLNRSFPYKVSSNATFKVYINNEDKFIERKYPVDFSINRQIPNLYLGDVEIDIITGIEGN